MTNLVTLRWRRGIKRPPELVDRLKEAKDNHTVTVGDLVAFIERFPEVDTQRKTCLSYAKKFIADNCEGKPREALFPFWFKKTCSESSEFDIDSNFRYTPRITDDFYLLWTRCKQWEGSRTGNFDNGWWTHGLRLMARYQYFHFLGVQNWVNAKGKPRAKPGEGSSVKRKASRSDAKRANKKKSVPASDLVQAEDVDDEWVVPSGPQDSEVRPPPTKWPEEEEAKETSVEDDCAMSVFTDVTDSNLLDLSEHIMSDYKSQTRMKDRLRKFTDALFEEGKENGEHLYPEVSSVYLGRVFPYTNYKHRTTTHMLHKDIDSAFKNMTKSEYEFHPLREFFELRKNGVGYQPIMIRCRTTQNMTRLGVIDHVVPKAWSFLDHPRFFVYIHTRINSHMADHEPPEYRIASGMTKSEIREMQAEIKKIKLDTGFNNAINRIYHNFQDKVRPR